MRSRGVFVSVVLSYVLKLTTTHDEGMLKTFGECLLASINLAHVKGRGLFLEGVALLIMTDILHCYDKTVTLFDPTSLSRIP